RKGVVRRTVSIPGTGLSWRSTTKSHPRTIPSPPTQGRIETPVRIAVEAPQLASANPAAATRRHPVAFALGRWLAIIVHPIRTVQHGSGFAKVVLIFTYLVVALSLALAIGTANGGL